VTVAAGAGVIRKRGGSLQVQVFAGRDPLTGRKRWLSRQVDGQTKAAWREAKKVEAQLLEQLDRGEQRGSRTRTVAELVERWLEWRQQVRPISPVTVANYRGAIDRYILPNAIAQTAVVWPSRSQRASPFRGSQTRRVLSSDAETSMSPLSDQTRQLTAASWPLNPPVRVLSGQAQRLMTLLSDPKATVLPSGCQASAQGERALPPKVVPQTSKGSRVKK
jgi:hypothetical protein